MKNKQLLLFFFLFVLLGVFLYFRKSSPGEEKGSNQKISITEKCGVENCHGLDIKCGPNIPDVCTSIYELGDNCRQLTACEVQNNQCQLKKSPSFDQCKSCVENCQKISQDDPVKLFSCESNCSQTPNEQD